MLKYFRYRIYPTVRQEVLINKHIGGARFVYNLALETKLTAYAGNRVNLSCFDLIKQLPDLKSECTWLNDLNSQSLQSTIRHLENTFTAFHKGNGGFPKFKKKSKRGSFTIPQNVMVTRKKLIVPKFKEGIKAIVHRLPKGEIKQAIISRTSSGKYYVSVLCETGQDIPAKKKITEETTVGIDLGIKSYVVTSEGKEYDNPKFLKKSLPKLKYLQRRITKYKGKKNRIKITRLYEKVANQRKDFLHKVTSELVKNHDSLAIESLKVSNMLKNHKLSQAISDAAWGKFCVFLKYKAEWAGKNVLEIGVFDPSSKTCSCCGVINKELTLEHRVWVCKSCGTKLNRDVNAAVNIKNFALKRHLSVERRLENWNELPTLVGVMTSESCENG